MLALKRIPRVPFSENDHINVRLIATTAYPPVCYYLWESFLEHTGY